MRQPGIPQKKLNAVGRFVEHLARDVPPTLIARTILT